MKKEEILKELCDIRVRYTVPLIQKNYTDKDYTIEQLQNLILKIAYNQEDKEIERLNNIIDDLERICSKELLIVDKYGISLLRDSYKHFINDLKNIIERR